MKQPAAYYLLLLYCTLMVRCAVPVACDALSHLFSEEDHIATVHAVYGSHHLQAEVAGAVSGEENGKHTNAQQDEPTVVHTFPPSCSVMISIGNDIVNPYPFHSYPLYTALLCCAKEPPESC